MPRTQPVLKMRTSADQPCQHQAADPEEQKRNSPPAQSSNHPERKDGGDGQSVKPPRTPAKPVALNQIIESRRMQKHTRLTRSQRRDSHIAHPRRDFGDKQNGVIKRTAMAASALLVQLIQLRNRVVPEAERG